jgi:hypothetical protein
MELSPLKLGWEGLLVVFSLYLHANRFSLDRVMKFKLKKGRIMIGLATAELRNKSNE